jgi:hypothetical protein
MHKLDRQRHQDQRRLLGRDKLEPAQADDEDEDRRAAGDEALNDVAILRRKLCTGGKKRIGDQRIRPCSLRTHSSIDDVILHFHDGHLREASSGECKSPADPASFRRPDRSRWIMRVELLAQAAVLQTCKLAQQFPVHPARRRTTPGETGTGGTQMMPEKEQMERKNRDIRIQEVERLPGALGKIPQIHFSEQDADARSS